LRQFLQHELLDGKLDPGGKYTGDHVERERNEHIDRRIGEL
jgi:hypothetical protein